MEEKQLDEFTALILIKSFIDNNGEKWEKYRDIAANTPKSHKLVDYVNELFVAGIQAYTLTKDTELYRARLIRRTDWNDTGVVKKKINENLFSIFLSQEEICRVQTPKLKISPENVLYLKLYRQGGATTKQLEKFEELSDKYSKPSFYGFSARGCGLPPKKCRKNYRLSRKTDANLYLSTERETAIQEMRPIIEQTYNIGVGITTRDLKLANLRDEGLYNTDTFDIGSILFKISEPNTEVNEKFYNITQLLAKHIKKQGFDGILYKSSLKKDGTNIMLFSPKFVRFISSEIITIKDINIYFDTVYPQQPQDVSNNISDNPKSPSSSQ